MRKIIALTVCLSLLCISSVCMFPAAYANGQSSSVEVLKALNIGSLQNPDDVLTRGAFTDAVSDILNYGNRPQNTDGIFPDAGADSPYSGAIYDMHSRGLVSGFSDGTFGTDSPILYEHAVKILVSALGYDNLAASYGGYPSGYTIIADQNRIMRGVVKNSGETLTVSEGARLIENAMNTPAHQQIVFGSETAVFEAYEGETLLSIYAKIEKIEGVVSDNGITSLTGDNRTKSGNVIIDGQVYSAAGTNAADYLGYKTTAYVTCKGDENEKVMYISVADTVNILAIPASRILYSDPGFSVQNIVYEDVYGNIKKANADAVADCIYNGSAYFDLNASDLRIDFGKIILVDNNADSVYDVICVETSEIVLVSGVSADKKIIHAKNGGSIKLENCNNIEVYRDGKKCDFNDISQWDVVCAQISLDKTTAVINASSQKLSGNVDAVSKSDRTISVNGRYYHVTTDELIEKIDVSSAYEFCLDADMNIAGIKSENQDNYYVGILVNAAQKSGVDSNLQIYVFSSLGNFDVLDLSDRVEIDGNKTMTLAQKEAYIIANMKDKLVSCKINAAGEVAEIYLPYTGEPAAYQTEESLRAEFEGEEEMNFHSPGNFAGKIVSDAAGTTVFMLPLDRGALEDYSVTSGSYFVHSTTHNIIGAYSIGADNGYSEFILRQEKSAEEYSHQNFPIVVEKVSQRLNAQGEIVEYVKGYDRYGDVELETKTFGIVAEADVKAGDVIRYMSDVNNKVLKVEKLVDGQTVTAVMEVGTAFGDSPRLWFCDVYSRYDNILGYTKTDLSKPFNETTVKSGLTVQAVSKGIKVYEVDTENDNKISVADYNAILPYTDVGVERSKMFIHSHSGTAVLIVVYN